MLELNDKYHVNVFNLLLSSCYRFIYIKVVEIILAFKTLAATEKVKAHGSLTYQRTPF